MDASRFDAWTRRRFGLIVGSGAASLLGLSVLGDAEAKKHKHKRKKHKKKKGPNCNGKCGGNCPRCRAGSSCDTRDECTTALCVNDVCTSPVNPDECGLDTNGDNCFARDSVNADRFCSRQICTLFSGVSCENCKGDEQCAPANGGADIECCAPCGSPL